MATKNDIARVGVFSEPSYISTGDPYKDNHAKPFNEQAYKGKQMKIVKGGKTFNESGRLFEGEGYFDPVKHHRRQRAKQKSKNIGKEFVSMSSTKSTGGSGNYANTFGGKIEAFSAAEKPKKKYEKEPRNFLTNPPKKGTFGVPGTTLAKLPEYKGDDYNAMAKKEKEYNEKHKASMRGGPFKATAPKNGKEFDGNPFKEPANAPKQKAIKTPEKKVVVPFKPTNSTQTTKFTGTFAKYPEYKPQGPKKEAPKKKAPIFKPVSNIKPTPTRSIMSMTVSRSINSNTFRSQS